MDDRVMKMLEGWLGTMVTIKEWERAGTSTLSLWCRHAAICLSQPRGFNPDFAAIVFSLFSDTDEDREVLLFAAALLWDGEERRSSLLED